MSLEGKPSSCNFQEWCDNNNTGWLHKPNTDMHYRGCVHTIAPNKPLEWPCHSPSLLLKKTKPNELQTGVFKHITSYTSILLHKLYLVTKVFCFLVIRFPDYIQLYKIPPVLLKYDANSFSVNKYIFFSFRFTYFYISTSWLDLSTVVEELILNTYKEFN